MKTCVLAGLSLESLAEQGRALVEVLPAERDGLWAYNACKLSRRILEEVEERWPPARYVSEEILEPLFRDLPAKVEEVAKAGRAGDWAQYVPHFADNIRDRIAKLEKYVRNPPISRE
jgi:hypothetical protein